MPCVRRRQAGVRGGLRPSPTDLERQVETAWHRTPTRTVPTLGSPHDCPQVGVSSSGMLLGRSRQWQLCHLRVLPLPRYQSGGTEVCPRRAPALPQRGGSSFSHRSLDLLSPAPSLLPAEEGGRVWCAEPLTAALLWLRAGQESFGAGGCGGFPSRCCCLYRSGVSAFFWDSWPGSCPN